MCGCTCFWNTCWILKQAKAPVRIRPSGLFLRFGVSNLCLCLWSKWLREDVWNMIERCRVGVLVQNVSSSKKVPGSLATICGRQYIQCVFGLLNSSGLMKFMMCLQYMFLSGIWDSEMTMHAFSQVPKPHGILNGSAKYNGDVSTLLGGWSCFDPNISKSKSTLHLTMVSCWTLRSGYILLNCKNTCTISLLGFQSSMGRRPQDFFLDFGIPNKCISCGRAAQVW